MNIVVISSTATYHNLAQRFIKENNVSKVYHIGAHKTATATDKYVPITVKSDGVPVSDLEQMALPDEDTDRILDYIKDKNIDFVIASSLVIPSTERLHAGLRELDIPYFFVSPKSTILERNKFAAKYMLELLDIPTAKGDLVTGEELFETFKDRPRPFVVKVNYLYYHGMQTTVVTDDNYEEVFYDLFSGHLKEEIKITNIKMSASIVVEECIKVKREYSYHMLVNAQGWKYLGSARDYKKAFDGDKGYNSSSMGCYNVDDIDPRVHEYADKIVNYLKENKKTYKGFMFLGIAHDENDVPYVLEINTRSGDPELQAILGSVTNNLADLFLAASRDEPIPDIVHNDTKTVTIRIVNRVFDWTKPASFMPKMGPVPEDIMYAFEYSDPAFIKHSMFTADGSTHEEASRKIYNYLDAQFMGQYRYRRDVGILK